VRVPLLGFFMFLSAVCHVLLSIRMQGLGGKVGSACEEFEDTEGGIVVNVSGVLVPAHPSYPGVKDR